MDTLDHFDMFVKIKHEQHDDDGRDDLLYVMAVC